jgi:hypothetical protein
MIVALLFLILFAILFPNMLRVLLALMFIGGIMILGEVHAASPNVQQLISHERQLDAQCRGNGTDCATRQRLAWQLQNLGWCWGKINQYGADMRWHKCSHDSQRMTLRDLHLYDITPLDCSGPILKLSPECSELIKNN